MLFLHPWGAAPAEITHALLGGKRRSVADRDCERLRETLRDRERLVVAVDRSESATTAAAVSCAAAEQHCAWKFLRI